MSSGVGLRPQGGRLKPAGVSGKCAVATKQLSSFPDRPDHGDLS